MKRLGKQGPQAIEKAANTAHDIEVQAMLREQQYRTRFALQTAEGNREARLEAERKLSRLEVELRKARKRL